MGNGGIRPPMGQAPAQPFLQTPVTNAQASDGTLTSQGWAQAELQKLVGNTSTTLSHPYFPDAQQWVDQNQHLFEKCGASIGRNVKGLITVAVASTKPQINFERLLNLDEMRHVQEMDLRIPIGTEGARMIAQSPNLSKLTVLNLDHSRIGPEGAIALAQSPYLSRLTVLDLVANSIDTEGTIALAQSSNFSDLAELYLAFNGIKNEAAITLTRSPHLSRLTVLDLVANGIGAEGAIALAQSPYFSDLTNLALLENSVGTEGAIALAQSPKLPHLIGLYLYHSNWIGSNLPQNGIGPEGFAALRRWKMFRDVRIGRKDTIGNLAGHLRRNNIAHELQSIFNQYPAHPYIILSLFILSLSKSYGLTENQRNEIFNSLNQIDVPKQIGELIRSRKRFDPQIETLMLDYLRGSSEVKNLALNSFSTTEDLSQLLSDDFTVRFLVVASKLLSGPYDKDGFFKPFYVKPYDEIQDWLKQHQTLTSLRVAQSWQDESEEPLFEE